MTLTIRRCRVRVVCDRPWGSESESDWIALVRRHLADMVLPALEAEAAAIAATHVPGIVRMNVALAMKATDEVAPAVAASRGDVRVSARADLRTQARAALVAAGAGTERPGNRVGSERQAIDDVATRGEKLAAVVLRARARLGRTTSARAASSRSRPIALPLLGAEHSSPADGAARGPAPSREVRRQARPHDPEVADVADMTSHPRLQPHVSPTADPASVPSGPASARHEDVVTGSTAEPMPTPIGDGAYAVSDNGRTPSREPGPTAPAAGSPTTQSGEGPARPSRFQISTCLPFLLLGPWSALGVLDTITVAFDDRNLLDELPALAARLAARLLPPPHLGWYRPPGELATIALFAGLDDPTAVRDDRLSAAGQLDPVPEVITEAVIAGRNRDNPVLAAPIGGGLVVADAAGSFPILWGAHPFALAALHERLGRPAVLTSGERVGRLRELAARFDAAIGRPRRPLDDLLDLVVAGGLSLVAWKMAATMAEPDPLLALDHLADLEADVAVDEDRLQVRLPLGTRFFALAEADLVGTVTDVPWLPGTTIELTAA
jgi:hypothetical protein